MTFYILKKGILKLWNSFADTVHQDGVAQNQTTADGEGGQPSDLVTPRLVNGPLKICALNSSFLVFLRAYPVGCFKKHKVSQIKFFFWYVLWL